MPLFGTQFVNLSGDAAMKGIALGQQAAATGMEGKLKQQQLRQQQSQFDATSGLRAQQERLLQYQADAQSKQSEYIDQFAQQQLASGQLALESAQMLLPYQIDQAAYNASGRYIENQKAQAELDEFRATSADRQQQLKGSIELLEQQKERNRLDLELLGENVRRQTSPLAKAVNLGAMFLTKREQEVARERLNVESQRLSFEEDMLGLTNQVDTLQKGLQLSTLQGQQAFQEMLGSPEALMYVQALSPSAQAMLGPLGAKMQAGEALTPQERSALGVALQSAIQFDLASLAVNYKESSTKTGSEFRTKLESAMGADAPADIVDLYERGNLALQNKNYKAADSYFRRATLQIDEHIGIKQDYAEIEKLGSGLIAAAAKRDELDSAERAEADVKVPAKIRGMSAEKVEQEVITWMARNRRPVEGGSRSQSQRALRDWVYTFGTDRERELLTMGAGGTYVTLDDEVEAEVAEANAKVQKAASTPEAVTRPLTAGEIFERGQGPQTRAEAGSPVAERPPASRRRSGARRIEGGQSLVQPAPAPTLPTDEQRLEEDLDALDLTRPRSK